MSSRGFRIGDPAGSPPFTGKASVRRASRSCSCPVFGVRVRDTVLVRGARFTGPGLRARARRPGFGSRISGCGRRAAFTDETVGPGDAMEEFGFTRGTRPRASPCPARAARGGGRWPPGSENRSEQGCPLRSTPSTELNLRRCGRTRTAGTGKLVDTGFDVRVDVLRTGRFFGGGKPRPIAFPDPATTAARGSCGC